MKFHWGALPEQFTPDESWHSITEPSPIMLQFVAAPIAIATGALFLWLWQGVLELNSPHIPRGWETIAQLSMLLSFPLLILVHEFLHALAYPQFGMTSETLIGCWPSRGLFYAYYNGPLSRNRFLTVFAMPFVVISVLPLCIAYAFTLPEIVSNILAWFSIWNAIFACGDILGFGLILAQVPSHATVRNRGWRTYWQPLPCDA